MVKICTIVAPYKRLNEDSPFQWTGIVVIHSNIHIAINFLLRMMGLCIHNNNM